MDGEYHKVQHDKCKHKPAALAATEKAEKLAAKHTAAAATSGSPSVLATFFAGTKKKGEACPLNRPLNFAASS